MKKKSLNPYLEMPCDRCGSKRIVSRRWKETVETFAGSVTVDCEQIDCSNKECQILFEQLLFKENAKKEELRLKREQKSPVTVHPVKPLKKSVKKPAPKQKKKIKTKKK